MHVCIYIINVSNDSQEVAFYCCVGKHTIVTVNKIGLALHRNADPNGKRNARWGTFVSTTLLKPFHEELAKDPLFVNTAWARGIRYIRHTHTASHSLVNPWL